MIANINLPRILRVGAGASGELAATLLESLIGATLQTRLPWLSNELVNGIQTLLAALLAMVIAVAGETPSVLGAF